MLPAIPIAVTGLAAISYFFSRKRKKIVGMTAKRQIIYDHAIRKVKDPVKLRALADAFTAAGLPAQADLLNKRAELRELPDEIKEARRAAYKQGMTLTDPVKVRTLAAAFAAQGATGAAASLMDYAAGLVPGSTVTTSPTDDVSVFAPEPTAPAPTPVAAAPITSDSSTPVAPTAPAVASDVVVPPDGTTTVEQTPTPEPLFAPEGDLIIKHGDLTIEHKEAT